MKEFAVEVLHSNAAVQVGVRRQIFYWEGSAAPRRAMALHCGAAVIIGANCKGAASLSFYFTWGCYFYGYNPVHFIRFILVLKPFPSTYDYEQTVFYFILSGINS